VFVEVDSALRNSLIRRLPAVAIKDMRKALKDSVDASGLFRKTDYLSESDLQLKVTMLASKVVKEGDDEYLWSPARWELKDTRTGRLIFDEQIVQWHRVNVKEEPNEVVRNTRLMEGAVKKNIREGLEQLATLQY